MIGSFYNGLHQDTFRAISDLLVQFDYYHSETTSLVVSVTGTSGSGKSTLGYSLSDLIEEWSASSYTNSKNLLQVAAGRFFGPLSRRSWANETWYKFYHQKILFIDDFQLFGEDRNGSGDGLVTQVSELLRARAEHKKLTILLFTDNGSEERWPQCIDGLVKDSRRFNLFPASIEDRRELLRHWLMDSCLIEREQRDIEVIEYLACSVEKHAEMESLTMLRGRLNAMITEHLMKRSSWGVHLAERVISECFEGDSGD